METFPRPSPTLPVALQLHDQTNERLNVQGSSGASRASRPSQASRAYRAYRASRASRAPRVSRGLQWPPCLQGLQGLQSLQGLQGLQGLQDLQGLQGPPGAKTSQGSALQPPAPLDLSSLLPRLSGTLRIPTSSTQQLTPLLSSNPRHLIFSSMIFSVSSMTFSFSSLVLNSSNHPVFLNEIMPRTPTEFLSTCPLSL